MSKELPKEGIGPSTKELLVTGKEPDNSKLDKERASYIEKLNKEQEAKQQAALTKGDSETAKINQKLETIDKKNKAEDKSGLGDANRVNAPLAAGILRHAGNTAKEDDLIKRESHVKGHVNSKGEEDAEKKFLDTRI